MPSEIPSMFLSSQPPFPTPRNFHTLFFLLTIPTLIYEKTKLIACWVFDVEQGPRSELRSYLWYWSTSSCLIIISTSTQSSYYIILVSLRTLITSIEPLNHHREHQDITKYFPRESLSKVDECWDFSSRVWIIHSRGKLFCHPEGDLCFNHYSRFCVIFPFFGVSLICFGFHLIFVCWPRAKSLIFS